MPSPQHAAFDFSEGSLEQRQLAYINGKHEVIQGVNQFLKIFWEVWRDSLPFKTEIMKIIYLSLNEVRPKFMSEIIIKTLDQKGPTPQIFDVKHLTPVLSKDP